MIDVFIVDDEEDILIEIEDILREYGDLKITGSFTDPQKAVKKAAELKPDCAFVDIKMPVINGFDLAQELQEINPQIEIVFITAFNDFATEAFELNAIDYILKPVKKERVNIAVERIIRSCTGEKKHIDSTEFKIYCFGRLKVLIGETHIKWKSQKAAELFAYLLHKIGEPVNKEKIINDIWPGYEPQRALINLQTAVYRIKKSLNCLTDRVCISYFNNKYKMVCDYTFYDADEFIRITDVIQIQTLSSRDIETLLAAISLYRGDYLEEDGFSWAMGYQEMLRKKYIMILQAIADYYFQREDYHNAAKYLQMLTERSFFDVKAYEMLFSALAKMKDVSTMINCYDRLKEEADELWDNHPPQEVEELLENLKNYI